MKWLKASGYRQMPWKNGGGLTREIALAPGRDGDFGWRLSIATIAQSGPFSSFAGIDRSIALLDGDGVVLEREDGESILLDKSAKPYFFDGGVSVYARCLGGEATDLNIMTRRGHFHHRMQQLIIAQTTPITNTAERTFVVFAQCAMVTAGHKTFMVQPYDAVELSERQVLSVMPQEDSVTLFTISLREA